MLEVSYQTVSIELVKEYLGGLEGSYVIISLPIPPSSPPPLSMCASRFCSVGVGQWAWLGGCQGYDPYSETGRAH